MRSTTKTNGVLFLDFDGVLNSSNWYRARTRTPNPTQEEHHLNELDPSAVAQLSRIIRETNCSVVISSTWRRGNSVGYLIRILVKRGLSNAHWGNFIGATPILDGRLPSGIYTAPERGLEIQAWLDDHPEKFEHVVILDDDSDMAHLLPNLIGCNGNEGLTAEKATLAIEILSGRAMVTA